MAFQPGQSGNPAGRPKGSKHKALRLVEAMLEGGAREVVEAVLQAARNGDVAACRVVLERILPVRRERPVEISLPDTSTAAGVSKAAQCVLESVADGTITWSEGKALADMVEMRRKCLELEDIEQRLQVLEQRQK